MSARNLLTASTPRPWRKPEPIDFDSDGNWGVTFEPEDAALIVAAVNEYEAHDAIAERLRALTAACALDPANGPVMVCILRDEAKELLAQLDAARRGE